MADESADNMHDEGSLPAKKTRSCDADNFQSLDSYDGLLRKLNFSSAAPMFPPLSSQNSGVSISVNGGQLSTEGIDDDDEIKETTIVPKISKVVHVGTGMAYVLKVVEEDSKNAALEEKTLRSSMALQDGGFLAQLIDSFLLSDNKRLFLLRCSPYGNLNELFSVIGARPLDLSSCARIAMSLAGAMDFLHNRRVSHGFLSLEHCLLDELYNVRLCGLGNLYEGLDARTYRWIDNKCMTIYFAPEVCLPDQSVNPFAVDMFACGVVLHRCILGVFPRSGSPSSVALMQMVQTAKQLVKHTVKTPIDDDGLVEMIEPLKTVRDLLVDKPTLRPGSRALLSSPWIQMAKKNKHSLPLCVFSMEC